MADEALELRRPYYSDVSLNDGPGFCIDDRISEKPAYIKFPGGLLFLASNLAIMRCLNNQSRLSQMEAVELVSKGLSEKGYIFGIHSDDSSPNIQETEGKIGCGYLSRGEDIARLITEKPKTMLKELKELRPDLFNDISTDSVRKITNAFKDLLSDDIFFSSSPREVARETLSLGTPYMEVKGQHDPRAIGIINLVKDTTLETSRSAEDGLPAYNYDAWAFNEVSRTIEPLSNYDQVVMEQAATINAIATFWLLGVNDIYVRK